jgi:hypothetical protein
LDDRNTNAPSPFSIRNVSLRTERDPWALHHCCAGQSDWSSSSDVWNQKILACDRGLIVALAHRPFGRQVRQRLAGDRVDRHEPPVRAERCQHQPIVGQDGLHDFRDAIEDAAHIEAFGHREQQ